MRRPFLSRTNELLLAILTTAASCVVTLLVGGGLDTGLGVAGLLFGVVTLVLSQVREREGPRKRIWYIGQEDAVFNDNVLKGLTAALDGVLHEGPVPAFPGHVGEALTWQ